MRVVFDTELSIYDAMKKVKQLLAKTNAAPHYTGTNGYNFFPAHRHVLRSKDVDAVTVSIIESNSKTVIVLRKMFLLKTDQRGSFDKFEEVFSDVENILSENFTKR